MIARRRELEIILEKTCGWFGIGAKADIYLPPPPQKPIREFTFERVKRKGLVVRKQKKFGKLDEAAAMERKMQEQRAMALIDDWFDELKKKRMFSNDIKDTQLDVKEDKRVISDVDCRLLSLSRDGRRPVPQVSPDQDGKN